ncbi:hypothetical protein PVK06_009504 [Gossypium arboreum]|uniref:Uncharacterized protein n=1 Tax=Gossypium arboreum TaxID=29729 RepID=A0ABR0QMN6_GOSAR|nr:hypothetical protein PVK06_009504 [Gossypium arboreum]
MTNTRGKFKVVVPASKKRKGPGTTSSSASTKVRHPYLQFSADPPEDLLQLLCMRLLGLGQCIDWAVLEQVGLVDEAHTFITTAPWDRFFDIVEPTYMELTLEFCSTFYLQRVMSSHDEHGTITFQLGGLVRHMRVPEFGAVLGIYTDEFMGADNFLPLHRNIYYSPSCC